MKNEKLIISVVSIMLLVTGFCLGIIYAGSFEEPIKHKQGYSPKGNKIEYYLELDHDSAIVESSHGKVYKCHFDSIPQVLNMDNL